MASEIRVNTINNRSGLGTISINDSGASFSGVVTATGGFSGDLTGNATGLSGSPTLSIGAGSTSAPSLSPSGDSNTGIFFPSADTIAFGEGGAEVARIDSSGRLLVGTNTAVTTIQRISSSDTPAFQYQGEHLSIRRTDDQPYFSLVKGNTVVNDAGTGRINFQGYDGSNHLSTASIYSAVDGAPGTGDMPGRLVFATTSDSGTSPTERMRIGSNGNVTLNGGNLVLSNGAGIDFSATSDAGGMTSELLDDYEEGSWAPTLIYDVPGTSSFTYNGSQTVGRYIKIGRLVYVKYKVVLTAFSKGTASGDLYITGLPFTVEAGNVGESVSTVFMYDTPFDNTKHQQWIANANSSDIRLKEVGNNAAHTVHTDPDSTAQYGGCLTYTT